MKPGCRCGIKENLADTCASKGDKQVEFLSGERIQIGVAISTQRILTKYPVTEEYKTCCKIYGMRGP